LTKPFATAAFAAAALFVSSCAFAQTAAPATPAQTYSYTVSGAGGVTFTKKTGGFISAEAGKQLWPGADITVEGGWMSNVVNSQTLDAAGAIADYLTQTQGQPSSATVKVPAGYGAANFRYAFYMTERYNVYAIGGAGFAVTSPNPSFTIGGNNVGSSVGQYGVTLGKDLAGSSTGFLLNLGVGVTIPYGVWLGDVGYRFSPIFANGTNTPVSRLTFGLGRRF